MLAIRDSEPYEEDDDDEEEEEGSEDTTRVKNDCLCHNHPGKSHIDNMVQKEFLSKRIDSKQRLRGYVNLRGFDVPLPWMIWYGDDPTSCDPYPYKQNHRKY